ncbi:12158_t:CDS:2 [Rhizophagus irregularis]|nr:12158_t:CDS:2 [Rhizophagus irregularis]
MSETERIYSNPPPYISSVCLVQGNLRHFEAKITGPPDTPYEGGVFLLDINIPTDYPMCPPMVCFIYTVLNGFICLDILMDNWRPYLNIAGALLSIVSFLTDPNPDCVIDVSPEISRLYKDDYDRYEATVREWTRKYAMGDYSSIFDEEQLLDALYSVGNAADEWILKYWKGETKEINGTLCKLMVCIVKDSDDSPCGKTYVISDELIKNAIIHLINCHNITKQNEFLEEDNEKINSAELLQTVMNFPTQWDFENLAKKDLIKSEKIRLTQDEEKLIQELKSILDPFSEIIELLKGNCTYSLISPLLLEIKNKFYSEDVNTVEINFEDEGQEAKDSNKNNYRIQINEPVDCTGLIDKIKLNLSVAIDHYWKDLLDPNLILFSILDPRIKRLSFISTSKRYEVENLLHEKYKEMKSVTETKTNHINENEQKQKRTNSILASLKKSSSTIRAVEVSEYLHLEEIDLDSNPFTWWKERKEKFPILYHFAIKYLSVYATSTINEKLFSDINNSIYKNNSELFKYLIFLKQNNKNLESINNNV